MQGSGADGLIMMRTICLAGLLALTGIAIGADLDGATIAEMVSQAEERHVEAALSEESANRDVADQPRCLQLRLIRDADVIDDRHVIFRTGRDQYHLVQMPYSCLGLERNATIAFSNSGTRLCHFDTIHPMLRVGAKLTRGPGCQIPSFQAITKEQIQALKDRLRRLPVEEQPG